MGGRATASSGERLAEAFITKSFVAAGLEPGGDRGTFAQAFPVRVLQGLGARNELRTRGAAFRVGVDWQPLAFSKSGRVESAPVVWAGYGVVAPASADHEGRDDFAGIDVKGRWAIVVEGLPSDLETAQQLDLQRFAALPYKLQMARVRGAVGVLLVDDPPESEVPEALSLLPSISPPASKDDITVVAITRDTLRRLLAEGRTSIQLMTDEASGAHARAIRDVELDAQVEVEVEQREGHNVIGVLRASPSREVGVQRLPLVIGAHYDHLGTGGSHTTSRARDDEKGLVHPGADDNASGVAALLELAHYLSARRADGSLKLERDIIFAAWSGEEIGMVGSKYFVGDSLARRFDAYVNMDMIGRLGEWLVLWEMGTSSAWTRLVEQARSNATNPLSVYPDPRMGAPTDTMAFHCAHVPVLTAHTGGHPEYHTPRDTADRLSYDGLERITEFVAELARALASDPAMIDWVNVDRPGSTRCPGPLSR
jgi:hypothetical protein